MLKQFFTFLIPEKTKRDLCEGWYVNYFMYKFFEIAPTGKLILPIRVISNKTFLTQCATYQPSLTDYRLLLDVDNKPEHDAHK